ncbi:hypothetical protein [Cohaesibacter haloalkalitolerans]|uniref:hypothetical protein n=1 Tax=Cohaesibacter haloalkalitolerans TaxID=1162980 RepID=UPI000E65B382|nr:hypothetical protein [Cohaesibacter haloalkalitolerans]
MQLPISGMISPTKPIRLMATNAPQSEDASKQAYVTKAESDSRPEALKGTYANPPLTAETQASLLALQEDASPDTSVQSVDINGLSIIVSGHSVDARDGVSLLRTLSPSETKSMMAVIASMDDSTENTGDAGLQEGSQSGSNIIRLDRQGVMMEVETEALEALPEGATSAYMNEDFLHSRGRWSSETPLEMNNSDRAVEEGRRSRLETLMNTVDAERQLRAQYGQDVKLIYSHTDNSYIMLTPDDANYDTMKSAESAVQGVIDDVHKGFVDKSTVADILQRYGYTI